MKDCEIWQNRFSEYIDGRLSEAERDAVARHLSECDICSQAFGRFRAAHEALLLLAEPVQGRPVLSAVRARIRQEQERRRKRRWMWIPAPVLAACGLALFAAYGPGISPDRPVDTPEIALSVSHPPVPTVAEDAGTATSGESKASAVAAPSAVPVSGDVRTAAAPDVLRTEERPFRMAKVAPAGRTLHSHAAVVSRNMTTPAGSPGREPGPEVEIAHASEPAGQPKIMVVAYRPRANYCASLENPETGESLAEVSVNSTYAADGTVRRASVVLHFPPVRKAAGSDGDKDSPSSNIEGSIRSAWSADTI